MLRHRYFLPPLFLVGEKRLPNFYFHTTVRLFYRYQGKIMVYWRINSSGYTYLYDYNIV